MVRVLKVLPLQAGAFASDAGVSVPRPGFIYDPLEFDTLVELRLRGELKSRTAGQFSRLLLQRDEIGAGTIQVHVTSMGDWEPFETADLARILSAGTYHVYISSTNPTWAGGDFRDLHLTATVENLAAVIGCGGSIQGQPIGANFQYQGRSIGCGDQIVSPIQALVTEIPMSLDREELWEAGVTTDWLELDVTAEYQHDSSLWGGALSFELELVAKLAPTPP